MMKKLHFLVVASLFLSTTIWAQEAEPKESDPLKGLKVGILSYLDYSVGTKAEANGLSSNYNKFHVSRAYLNIKKKLAPFMSARLTPDAHMDDEGDFEVRLKYAYAEFSPFELGPLTAIVSEVGLGHTPWLDFEGHINPYRSLGSMAIERAGIFNSADLGMSVRGHFGDKLEDGKKRTGCKYALGRFGSWHVGVYNGGGYHAPENNEDKVVQGRLTMRPLPDLLPGLQLTYFGLYGRANLEGSGNELPLYQVNLGALSYQHPRIVLSAQVFTSRGNAKGEWLDDQGESLKTLGASGFGLVRLPFWDDRIAVLARYDFFNGDVDAKVAKDATYRTLIGGISIATYKYNMIVLAYERTVFGEDFGGFGEAPDVGNALGAEHKGQLVYQLTF
ncbi:hypothetical protein KAI87_13330 [Myxococcota bacterium]|nr:hypothetical protein [Myxococcota bacterium]